MLEAMKVLQKNSRFAHKDDIWNYCQKHLQRTDFDKVLASLQNNGQIYTTVDAD